MQVIQEFRIYAGNRSIEVTRLTYNCAHLRSTKESLMFEYFDIYFFIERYDKIIFNFKSHFIQTIMGQYGVVLVDT